MKELARLRVDLEGNGEMERFGGRRWNIETEVSKKLN